MTRNYAHCIEAKEINRNDKFGIPTSGMWAIAYGHDHTPMGYFIDFTPLDEIAKNQCTIEWDGSGDYEDPSEKVPMEEWTYNPISLDQLFTRPSFTAQDWVSILYSFGIEG